MDLRTAGTILLATVIVCLTWYLTTIRAQNIKQEQQKRLQRQKHSEKMNSDNTYALYQTAEAMRHDAETKLGIMQEQLRRRDNEIARLNSLIRIKEGK